MRPFLTSAGIWSLAAGLALVPLPQSFIERRYSTGLFPLLQSGLTWISNLFPFAGLDALVVCGVGWWLWRLTRNLAERRQGALTWSRVAARLASRTMTLAALLYLAFLLFWGFNYQREPLVARFESDAGGATPAAAEQLATEAVSELNALHSAAHAELTADGVSVDGSLAGAFARVQTLIGAPTTARPARPKWTMFDPYFTSAGVAGMTDPFFLETLVASDLLAVERPFVVAHEWSHLAGFANEGEANLLGWLACMQGGAADRYSGWLFLYSEALSGLPRSARAAVSKSLGEGPRTDLQAIADRTRRNVKPRVADAGWRAYDTYLRANRVEGGTASYREVVRMILTLRFATGWVPALKPSGD